MSGTICVDASFMVALLVPERFSPTALALWEEWIAADLDICAPALLRHEVTSAIYRKAWRSLISWDDALAVLAQFLHLDLEVQEPPNLAQRAFELAREFARPNTYDCFYLALAENLDCPLWSGDEHLFSAVKGRFPRIRSLL